MESAGMDHLAIGAFVLFGVAFVVLVVWVSNLQ